MTWDDIVACAGALPAVEVATSYGTPALKVGGKLLTRLRTEDDSLVLFEVPPEEREMLIATRPRLFHTTPHYAGHPIVLARLAHLPNAEALVLLTRRWRAVAPRRLRLAFDAQRA